jgi:hypothetical protein
MSLVDLEGGLTGYSGGGGGGGGIGFTSATHYGASAGDNSLQSTDASGLFAMLSSIGVSSTAASW